MKIEEFRKILYGSHRHHHFYHFTDLSNISSIQNFGILSKCEIARRKIEVNEPGGNEWSREADELKGLNNYVNLCFTTSHPMLHTAKSEGRIPNPKHLFIDPDIMSVDGAKITLGVANKSGTELLDIEDGLGQLDMEVLYTRTDWGDPEIQSRLQQAEKYEILIPNSVSVEFIRGIF